MKLFLWVDDFGGLRGYAEPFNEGDYAIGEFAIYMILAAVAAFFLFILNRMGAVLNIPFLFLMLALMAWMVITPFLGGMGAFLIIQPLVLYGWACYCWGIYGVTVATDEGYIGMLGWLLSGVVALLICCVLASELSAPVLMVPTALQIGVWWTALMAQDATGREMATTALKYMFRVALILSAVGVIVGLVDIILAFKNKAKTAASSRHGRRAFAFVATAIMLIYALGFVCFILTEANLAYLAPVSGYTETVQRLHSSGVIGAVSLVAGGFFRLFSELLSRGLEMLLGLIWRIFDASGPSVNVYPAIGAMVLGLVLVFILNLASLATGKSK